MKSCPYCGRPTILYGKGRTSVLDLQDDRAVRVPVPSQKVFCRHCNVVHADRAVTVSAAMIEACVAGVLAVGVAGTARKLGCDRSVVQGVFSDWVAGGEDELPSALPDTIGLHRVDFGGLEKILVTDAVEETLIEVVDDAVALRTWLSGKKGKPTLAVVDFDPRMAAMLEDMFPDIEVAVAPSSASRAVLAAAEASLRALVRRNADRARNFREDAGLLAISDADLSPDLREELDCWDDGPRAIRRMTRDVLEALETKSAEIVRRVIDKAIANLSLSSPVGALGKLLITWRDRILKGVSERWLGRVVEGAERISIGISGAVWPLKKNVRAYLLFSKPDRLVDRFIAAPA